MKTINSVARSSVRLSTLSTPECRAWAKRLTRRQDRSLENAALRSADTHQEFLDTKKGAAVAGPHLRVVSSLACTPKPADDRLPAAKSPSPAALRSRAPARVCVGPRDRPLSMKQTPHTSSSKRAGFRVFGRPRQRRNGMWAAH